MLNFRSTSLRRPVYPRPLALGVMALVAMGAAWNWAVRPDEASRWLVTMVKLPALWAALDLYRRMAMRRVHDTASADPEAVVTARRYFATAGSLFVVAFGSVDLARAGLTLAVRHDVIGLDPATSALNLVRAAVIIGIGNALPKVLTPIAMLPEGCAGRLQAARRYLGRAFVGFGAVLAIATVAAPLDVATRTRQWVGVACVATTVVVVIWMNLTPRRREA